jgi:hypothetical protein
MFLATTDWPPQGHQAGGLMWSTATAPHANTAVEQALGALQASAAEHGFVGVIGLRIQLAVESLVPGIAESGWRGDKPIHCGRLWKCHQHQRPVTCCAAFGVLPTRQVSSWSGLTHRPSGHRSRGRSHRSCHLRAIPSTTPAVRNGQPRTLPAA